jgi:ABC-type lipoprotein release transport system permease subunit
LAIALAVVVGVPVVHSLAVAVRSRRRDLALMSALGAGRRTLRWIAVSQGTTVVLAASVVGVPLGVVVGRWSWSGLAESFGTIPEPVVPLGPLAALAAAVLVTGALAGLLAQLATSRRATVASLRPE